MHCDYCRCDKHSLSNVSGDHLISGINEISMKNVVMDCRFGLPVNNAGYHSNL